MTSDSSALPRVGVPRGPVLMSAANPTGWRLEDLLPVLRAELEAKCTRIAGDGRMVARAVHHNNRQIAGLMMQAEAIQRVSVDLLAALGPDQGPGGTPRIGVGSAGLAGADPTRS